MLYLVINVLLQVIGFYLIFSTPQTEAWGPPPRALLGLLLVGLSLLTGLIFSLGVIWSKKHSRTVSAPPRVGHVRDPTGHNAVGVAH